MNTPTEREKNWIDWCHGDQSACYSDAAQDTVGRMVEISPYSNPIILAEIQRGQSIARGYAVACEGAIGYLGRVRFQGQDSDHQHFLALAIAELCERTLALGLEMVQAIVPADSTGPTDERLRSAFQAARMIRAAKLLQFECCDIPFQHDGTPLAMAFSPVRFRSYRDIPWERWCQLVEATYTDTLDVPILNGVRSIEQTLRGYAVGQSNPNFPWWSIHIDEAPIGCLILSSLSERDCELTYLGLISSARGRRYSPEIMDFVSQWMLDQGKSRIVLAVDEKNAPALHLYRSFGFEQIHAVEAWIAGRLQAV